MGIVTLTPCACVGSGNGLAMESRNVTRRFGPLVSVQTGFRLALTVPDVPTYIAYCQLFVWSNVCLCSFVLIARLFTSSSCVLSRIVLDRAREDLDVPFPDPSSLDRGPN